MGPPRLHSSLNIHRVKVPSLFQEYGLRTTGVDISLQLHPWKALNIEDIVVDGHWKALAEYFDKRCAQYLQQGMLPHFVFDGNALPGKVSAKESRSRAAKRHKPNIVEYLGFDPALPASSRPWHGDSSPGAGEERQIAVNKVKQLMLGKVPAKWEPGKGKEEKASLDLMRTWKLRKEQDEDFIPDTRDILGRSLTEYQLLQRLIRLTDRPQYDASSFQVDEDAPAPFTTMEELQRHCPYVNERVIRTYFKLLGAKDDASKRVLERGFEHIVGLRLIGGIALVLQPSKQRPNVVVFECTIPASYHNRSYCVRLYLDCDKNTPLPGEIFKVRKVVKAVCVPADGQADHACSASGYALGKDYNYGYCTHVSAALHILLNLKRPPEWEMQYDVPTSGQCLWNDYSGAKNYYDPSLPACTLPMRKSYRYLTRERRDSSAYYNPAGRTTHPRTLYNPYVRSPENVVTCLQNWLDDDACELRRKLWLSIRRDYVKLSTAKQQADTSDEEEKTEQPVSDSASIASCSSTEDLFGNLDDLSDSSDDILGDIQDLSSVSSSADSVVLDPRKDERRVKRCSFEPAGVGQVVMSQQERVWGRRDAIHWRNHGVDAPEAPPPDDKKQAEAPILHVIPDQITAEAASPQSPPSASSSSSSSSASSSSCTYHLQRGARSKPARRTVRPLRYRVVPD